MKDWEGQAPEPRVTTSDFDEYGLLRTVTVEPDHPELKRVTRFVRNDDGLPYRVIVAASGSQRNTFVAYDDAERMFPVATWNELAHYHRAVYHPGYGIPVATDDPNEVRTDYRYDSFGRVRRVAPAAGTAASISYASDECNTDLASTKGLCTSVHYDDGARHVAYSDEYGRTWEVGDSGFDGALVFRRREHNAFGQPVRTTRPFTQNAGPATMVRFDSLSRPQEILYPDATTTWFKHTMYTRRETDANANSSDVTLDLNGRVVESDDPSGPPRTYTYGPFDQIVAIEQLGYVTAIDYDKLGRRTRLDDPDKGVTRFAYNGFGQLRTSSHLAGGNPTLPDLVTELHYDKIGRTLLRTDTVDDDPADAVPPAVETTEYDYDATPHGLGKLRRTLSPDGIETVHTYDDLGRPKLTQWTVDGNPYKLENSYDNWGRLETLRYPEAGNKTFAFDYDYTTSGWHRAIAPHANAVWPQPTPLWQVTARNADGMLEQAQWKGGVTESRTHNALTGRLHAIDVGGDNPLVDLTYEYDPVGNVTLREDAIGQGRTETFEYDSADRLELWTLKHPKKKGGPDERITFYTYDVLGNLMGTMVNWQLDEVHTSDPVRPHRLASIHFLQGQGLREYSHDGRGRQDQDSDGRQIQYTAFDLPRHIAQNGNEVHFDYDAFGARVKKTSFEGGAVTTTITLGGVYERRERIDANTAEVQHVFYLAGDDGPVAQVMYDETSGAETTAYLARDGLGSVGVAFDKDGTVLERLYHEPFGRRTGADGAALPSFAPASDVSLGFTGHRHDDDLDLIDMNGRVYDAVQRRFLTPDPFVSNPFFSQSHNRYAYVLNNPLRYTDPSGFQEQSQEGLLIDVTAKNPPRSGPAEGPIEASGRFSQPTVRSSDSRGESSSFLGRLAMGAFDRLVSSIPLVVVAREIAHNIGIARVSIRQALAGELALAANTLLDIPQHNVEAVAGIVTGPFEAAMGIPGAVERAFDSSAAPEARGAAGVEAVQRIATVVLTVAGVTKGVQGAIGKPKPSTLQPGPFAGESIPARGPGRGLLPSEQTAINRIGQTTGCHTCGAKTSGTGKGNFVPDHQPPNRLADGQSQRLYPHCINCSRLQGGQVTGELTRKP